MSSNPCRSPHTIWSMISAYRSSYGRFHAGGLRKSYHMPNRIFGLPLSDIGGASLRVVCFAFSCGRRRVSYGLGWGMKSRGRSFRPVWLTGISLVDIASTPCKAWLRSRAGKANSPQDKGPYGVSDRLRLPPASCGHLRLRAGRLLCRRRITQAERRDRLRRYVRPAADPVWAGARRRGPRPSEDQGRHPPVREDRRPAGLPLLRQRHVR